MTAVFPFTPNWRDSVGVTIEFRTDIVVARSGREQRRSLRQSPRKSLSYRVTVDREERRRLVDFLTKNQGATVLAADPTRCYLLSEPVAADSGELVFHEPLPDWMVVGADVMIGETAHSIFAVDGGTVSVEPVNPAILPTGTIVRPALRGRISGTVGVAHPTDRVAEAVINFAVEPGSEPAVLPAAGLWQHNSREVFGPRPNWTDDVSVTFDWPVEQVDFGFGRTATYQPVDEGWAVRKASFVAASDSEANEIEHFFRRRQGRRGEFYMPTGTDDLTLVTGGTDDLVVSGPILHDAIEIRLYSGVRLFRTIEATPSGDTTILSLNAPLPVAISPDDVALISWMPLVRFGSDEQSFSWTTDQVVQIEIPVRTLETLTAEETVDPVYDGAAQWLLETWGEESVNMLDAFDFMVNIRYPAVFYDPLAWIIVHEPVADGFNTFVNFDIPESVG